MNPDATTALVLGGVDLTGKFSMYACCSPDFRLQHINTGFAVFGSGAVVHPYVKSKYNEICAESIPLKERADKLHVAGATGSAIASQCSS